MSTTGLTADPKYGARTHVETATQRQERMWRQEREAFAARDKTTIPHKPNIYEDWRELRAPMAVESRKERKEREWRQVLQAYASREKNTRPDRPLFMKRATDEAAHRKRGTYLGFYNYNLAKAD